MRKLTKSSETEAVVRENPDSLIPNASEDGRAGDTQQSSDMVERVVALQELAERCEAADEPERLLDADICVIVLGYVEVPCKVKGWRDFDTPDGYRATFRDEGPNWEPGWGWKPHFEIAPYTASLDAAMTLVPEELDFACGRGIDVETGPNRAACYAWVGEGEGDLMFASTPALALCAAALRARAKLHGAS
jgi:hypothetical protein